MGLIGIGWTPQDGWELGCKKARFVRGGCDSIGRVQETLDEVELRQAIQEVSEGVDALVVSGMFSVCNPWQESQAAEMAQEMSSLPVVMGHTLTGELGIKERTTTAILNAKLLPIINDFLTAVEDTLASRGIDARILVFKGDGGLMTIETARKRPVETILSGPAASLMGGKMLSNLDNCIVVDIGGTSTDIAYLDDGFPRLNLEGAMVGSWRTRVRAIDMWTCGLGGDSIIYMDKEGEIRIGPERVLPLAIASMMRRDFDQRMHDSQDTTFFVAGKRDLAHLSKSEEMVYNFISEQGPCSFYEVMDGVPEVVLAKDAVEALIARGNVIRTGLTPTDLMHISGDYEVGSTSASKIGLELLAQRMDLGPDILAERVMERVVTRIGEEILQKAMADENGPLPSNSLALEKMLHAAAGEQIFAHLKMKSSLDRPIVGIGAPAQLLIKPLKERMDAQVVIPPHYDVGNAIGAVRSQISESITIEVYARDNKFLVFSQFSSPLEFFHVEEALSSAKTSAERYVRERMELSRAEDVRVKIDVVDKRFSDGYGKEMKFINFILIRATALGTPKLGK